MIISRDKGFLFTAIPKTGTHSIRRALRAHLGPNDHEQVRLFVEKHLPYTELARLAHGHITLQQVRPYLGEQNFTKLFKFAFVRNPFDRFISYCAFMTRHNDAFARDPNGVMRHYLFTRRPMQHILFSPQHNFVTDEEGRLLTDKLGRVEEMQSSYDSICASIGIASTTLDHVNNTNRGHYRIYYDQELIDGVADVYQRDLELFGYSF